jgi:hypothetical protein
LTVLFTKNNYMFENNKKENNKELKPDNKVEFGNKKDKTKIKIGKSEKVSGLSVIIYKRFNLIIFLEILLVLILGYLFIIRTEVLAIGDYDELVLKRQNELAKIKDYKKDSSEFEKRYNDIEKQVESDINKLYDILPPEEDLPNLMAQMEALASSHGFTLGSISMSAESSKVLDKRDVPVIASQKKVKKELIKEVDISLFIFSEDGGYARAKELLDAFEHHIRFINITSFSFEKDMKAYSIILKTYYLNYEE